MDPLLNVNPNRGPLNLLELPSLEHEEKFTALPFENPMVQNIGNNLSMMGKIYQASLNVSNDSNAQGQRFDQNVLSNIQTYAEGSSRRMDKLRQVVKKISLELIAGDFDDRRIGICKDVIEISKIMLQVLSDSANQNLLIIEQENQIIANGLQNEVQTVFNARALEMEYVHEKLLLFQTQGSHELKIFLTMHAQKLKEECKTFNRLFKINKFNVEQEERVFQRRVALQEQRRQEQEDLASLRHEEERVYRKHKKRMRQLHASRSVERHLDVDERREIADKKEKDGGCIIL